MRRSTTTSLALGLLGAALAVAACDENPESSLRYGAIEVTTTAPTAEKEISTADGWTIKPGKLLVHVSSIEIAGLDEVVAASATGQVVDLVPPGPKLLLEATARLARPWEVVTFRVGPATEESAPLEPVAEVDSTAMAAGGLSIWLEATATRGAETKTIKWGLASDITYTDCEGDRGGARVKGIVVPVDGTDTADIVMRGDVFFTDRLDGTGAIRFDADANGEVTLDELAAVPLDTARASGAYDVGDRADVTSLGAFVEALSPSLVASFRANGRCAASRTAPAEE
jgi:hypothetical protein